MGYLIIDNRANGGGVFETDTTFCRHCQGVIDKRKWQHDKGIWKCSKCDGPVCHHCSSIAAANNYACSPWKKQIEDAVKVSEMMVRRFGGPQ